MRLLEFLLFFFVVLSVLMCYAEIPGGTTVFTFAASILSGFYFFAGSGILRTSIFARLRHIPHHERAVVIIRAIAGAVFSFTIIAVLFNEQLWQGRQPMIYIGIFLLTAVMVLSLLFLENHEPLLNRYIFFRFWVLSLLLLFYMSVPLTKRLEWKFEDQYYREILQFSLENSDDAEARKTVKDYERRLQGLPLEEEGTD